MIKIKINNIEFLVKQNISVLEACKYVGITIPRFCYHETLSVAGNCRMCLVEIDKTPNKPVASCAAPVLNSMQIFTETPLVKKARENVIESLLINHPLDCPICDQGGECDLQDQTKLFGGDFSRVFVPKRGVEDKYCGPLIKTIMTRCIHCTRCVRFGSEIAGVEFLGILNRGTGTEIGGYIPKFFNSEISGNVIDLCPVGALTSKPYAFKARPWELRTTESFDLTDSLGSSIYINFKETELLRILPKNNETLNQNIISDKTRFSYDSVKTQRLLQLFKSEKKTFKSVDWSLFFYTIDNLIDQNKKIIFLIDEEIDFESISIIKQICYKFPTNFKVKSVSRFDNNKNYHDHIFNDKVIDIKKKSQFCFLLSSNIRLESSVINAKIRVKHFNDNLCILNSGPNYNSNIPLKFINFNIQSILTFIEGKNKLLSKLLIKSNSSLLFWGESLNKRISNNEFFISKLRKINCSLRIFKIAASSNTTGVLLIGNVYGINCKDILKTDAFISVNLSDTIVNRKLIDNLKKNNSLLFWLNTHGSKLASKGDFIVPTLTYFETQGTFINLEQRPQKTQKTFAGIKNARSLKNILKLLLSYKNETNFQSCFFSYLNEIIKETQKYDKNNTFLNNLVFPFNNKKIQQVSTYPLKSVLEDFYCSNNFTKKSLTMLKCSQETRKSFTNFFD